MAIDSPELVLFSTDHCTLCEQALDVLLGTPELQGYSLSVVDVAGDDELLERYGERLPVLRVGVQELEWPFGAEEISATIRQSEQG